MRCLLDANVLCEATKPNPDPRMIEWLRRNEGNLAIDPVILGEVRSGILVLPPGQRRRALHHWSMRQSRTFNACRGTPRRGRVWPGCWRIFVLSEGPCRSRTVSLPQLPPLPDFSLRPDVGEILQPGAWNSSIRLLEGTEWMGRYRAPPFSGTESRGTRCGGTSGDGGRIRRPGCCRPESGPARKARSSGQFKQA